MKLNLRRTGAGLALGLLAAAQAQAQGTEAFPQKPIQMIIHTGAGASTDTVMRMLARLAEPLLGQPILVVNRVGASGMIGVGAVAKSAPDGYTIGGVSSGPITIAPHMGPAGYKPEDYRFIAMASKAPVAFCVAQGFPASSAKQLLDEMRKNPGKYSYGNDGHGGFVHLAGERIFAAAGVKALPVPYAGANQTLTAFLGNVVDIFGGGLATIVPFARQGKAKCLLVTSAARDASLPTADSLSDIGIPETETLIWRGVIAPVGIPPERLVKLESAFAEAIRDPRFKQFAESLGETPWNIDPAAAGKYVGAEYRAMGELVNKLGLSSPTPKPGG